MFSCQGVLVGGGKVIWPGIISGTRLCYQARDYKWEEGKLSGQELLVGHHLTILLNR